MKSLRDTFLLISLSPLIFLVLISVLNLKDKYSLKILTFETPELRLGTIFLVGGGIGFLSSFAGVKGITTNYSFTSKKKYIFTNEKEILSSEINDLTDEFISKENEIDQSEKYIERHPRDPLPTITVPYRIRSRKTNDQYESSSSSNSNSNISDESISQNDMESSNQNSFNNSVALDDWNFTDLENW
tara:strand:- start:6028 stop:6588 length:561 start_codon:yes stop_codon:yes gene_type:complete